MQEEPDRTEEFRRHLQPLQGPLEAYCRRCLYDPSAVEDVLQTVVALALRDFDVYRAGTNFRAWIFRYLNLEIRAWNRRHAGRRDVPLQPESPVEPQWEQAFEESAFETLRECPDHVLEGCDDVLAAAVRGLPDAQRSTLLLRAIGEFAYREIAEILEIPVGTVMSHLSRARAALRKRLAEHCRREGLARPNQRDAG